jgi:lincosamide nucleotidyltransferase A/C/D/E
MMTAETVLVLCDTFEKLGVEVWLDGGWGVDALLEIQSRDHADLDIVIDGKDVARLRDHLERNGCKEIKLEIARPHNFVLADQFGSEIDIHVIERDERGDGIYGPPANGEMYPSASLTGIGSINAHHVKCISPEWTVRFHTGYKLKDKDYGDVSAVCKKFNLELPDDYKNFKKQ